MTHRRMSSPAHPAVPARPALPVRPALPALPALTLLALLAMSSAALAQQRPLITEDPEPIGAGRVLLEGGIDAAHTSNIRCRV